MFAFCQKKCNSRSFSPHNLLRGNMAFAALTLICLSLSVVHSAAASTITFDDLTGNDTAVPNGYNGFSWNNFYNYDEDASTAGGYNGYINGIVSSPDVIFNGYGAPASIVSSTPFTFNSAYMGAAWDDGVDVVITGDNSAGQVIDTATVRLSTSGSTLETFNWTGLSSLGFAASGGTPHPGAIGSGTEFYLDNVVVNEPITSTPEPSSFVSLTVLLAFGSLLFARARKWARL